MRSRIRRLRVAVASRPLLADAAAAAVLAAVGLLAVRVGIETAAPGYRPPPPAVWASLTLALVLPLAWRRRFPLGVLLVVTAVFFPYRIADLPDLTVSVVVWWLALYSAGAYGSRRWRDVVRAVNVVAALSFLTYRLVFVAGTLASGSLLLRGIFLVLFNVAFVVSAWIFGDVVAERRDYERALVDRARQLEREREEKARQAVFDERLRIARDLHDVVAHHVSVMGVQAGAARRVLTRQPAQAARALAAIEETSRQAVTELQRMLGFLRREGEQPDLAPQPRLGRLDALLGDLAGSALDVQVRECGTPRELPPTVEVSAYRIVQEALTNVLKHSTAERVLVRLVYEPRSFAVEITDDGRPREAARPAGGGHGVLGMRERTALHHGELVAAPLDSGGYQVRATFPVEAAVP